jgi:hypothetical protein
MTLLENIQRFGPFAIGELEYEYAVQRANGIEAPDLPASPGQLHEWLGALERENHVRILRDKDGKIERVEAIYAGRPQQKGLF